MSLESGLRAYFLADADVAAIVTTKVFPNEAPDSVSEPYITYQLKDTDEPRFVNGKRRYQKFGYEIECFAVEYDSAMALAEEVKKAVGGAAGDSVTTTLDGVSVVMFWNDPPIRKGHVSAQDKLRNQVSLDLVILVR